MADKAFIRSQITLYHPLDQRNTTSWGLTFVLAQAIGGAVWQAESAFNTAVSLQK